MSSTDGMSASRQRRVVGRYVLYGEIAAGGMATVHFGRLVGPVGFARTVAIKRLHPHLARDPEFVAMFLDEARLVARIRHPNVVPTLDIVASDGELLLVMEYIQGESLGKLTRAAASQGGVPLAVTSAIMIGVLEGLHAAHDARSDRGEPLDIVHRDVSPQNVLVGEDGVAHVLDFGVAKAAGRLQQTGEGQVKGKFAYMSPEQLAQLPIDRRTDVYAASVLLWETLTGRKAFDGDSSASVVYAVVHNNLEPPSRLVRGVPAALDAVVMRGLSKRPEDRFRSAHDMAVALEDALPPATPRRVQEWVQSVADQVLKLRAQNVAAIENDSAVSGTNDDSSAKTALEAVRDAGQRASSPSSTSPGTVPPAERSVTSGVDVSGGPRKSRLLVAGAVSGAAIAGVVLALGLSSVTANGPSPAASGGPRKAENETPEKATEPSAANTQTTVGSQVAVPGAAAESASAAPSASATPTHKRVAPGAGPAKPPKADCANPFTIDASGRKKPRPECFR